MTMHRSRDAFTLIELLVTISIIGMLAVLITPAIQRSIRQAQSMKCAANLGTIGTAVQLYATDNNNHFPEIEGYPTDPTYTDGKPGTLLTVLGPYGVTDATLRCPADLASKDSYYKKEGASYMWRPFVDDELTSAPKIYFPRRGEIVPPLSMLALAADFTRVHAGHVNCVFADGHVRLF